jgi:DNA-3-methyladenine glycosylase II
MSQAPVVLRVPPEAQAHLRDVDPLLAELMRRVGPVERPVEPTLWRSLVGAIVGQQISVKAAATIRARLAALGEDAAFPGPEIVLRSSDETLRACGLSRAKLSYIRDLAAHWVAGTLAPEELATLPDEEVIARLVQVRGVGRWTAEMVLIFALRRPDVFAVDDLGLRTAVQRLHGLAERPGGPELLRLAEPWRPYRSYAALYLWRSLAT